MCASISSEEARGENRKPTTPRPSPPASGQIPLAYISDSVQRIEIYRKLAQVTDRAALENLRTELRDRFGPLPPAMELLLQVAEIKILASEKSVTIIEVREGKLM